MINLFALIVLLSTAVDDASCRQLSAYVIDGILAIDQAAYISCIDGEFVA